MIIYNVTCSVEPSVSEDWLKWMKETHIPDVMESGFFKTVQINKVLSEKGEGETYAIQYFCERMKDLHNYQVNFASALQKKHTDKYGEKVVSFRTLLEVIDVLK